MSKLTGLLCVTTALNAGVMTHIRTLKINLAKDTEFAKTAIKNGGLIFITLNTLINETQRRNLNDGKNGA